MEIKLVLKRRPSFATGTLGELWLNGKFFCYTMEDVVRPRGVLVRGETAIEAGTYPVVLGMSPRLGILTPRLLGKLAARGILIHPGNVPADTLGCILVGFAHLPNGQKIYKSREAFEALMHRLLDATSISLTVE